MGVFYRAHGGLRSGRMAPRCNLALGGPDRWNAPGVRGGNQCGENHVRMDKEETLCG